MNGAKLFVILFLLLSSFACPLLRSGEKKNSSSLAELSSYIKEFDSDGDLKHIEKALNIFNEIYSEFISDTTNKEMQDAVFTSGTHILKALATVFDKDFDPDERIFSTVFPPIHLTTNTSEFQVYVSGMSPEGIKDKAVRAEYERMIKENNAKILYNCNQIRVREIKQRVNLIMLRSIVSYVLHTEGDSASYAEMLHMMP